MSDPAPSSSSFSSCSLSYVNSSELSFLLSNRHEYGVGSLIPSPPPSSLVLDIGGNIGIFSLQLAQNSHSITIHTFEPMPKLYQVLTQNVEKWEKQQEHEEKEKEKEREEKEEKKEDEKEEKGKEQNHSAKPKNRSQIITHELAIDVDEGKKTAIFLPNYTLLSGFHVHTPASSPPVSSTNSSTIITPTPTTTTTAVTTSTDESLLSTLAGHSLADKFLSESLSVSCTRLDSFLSRTSFLSTSPIYLLKIDVEKAEYDVLLSLGKRLKKQVEWIVLEIHQCNLKRIRELLVGNGQEEEGKGGFEEKYISEKSLPRYCLQHISEEDIKNKGWPEELNTYIAIYKNKQEIPKVITE